VQAARTHRFKLRGVRLNREELDVLARGFCQMVHEALPHIGVDGWVFDGRIGEDQRVRVDQIGSIGRDVGDQVAICIRETRVERKLGLSGKDEGSRKGECCGEQFHGLFLFVAGRRMAVLQAY
jgi:hypothetical protein